MSDNLLPAPQHQPSIAVSLTTIALNADRLMLALFWLLLAIGLLLGWHHQQLMLAFIAGGALTLSASAIKWLFPATLFSRLFFAVVMLGFAALFIQLGHGETEYHFSVFVLLSALLAYRDYRPLLMGAATAAVHHLLFNFLQQQGLFGVVVFPHPGFHMVVFHALFVIAQTAILIYIAVHMAADARAASEVAQLASWINREPGYLTLVSDKGASQTPFARTFSHTLDTMHDTLEQVSGGVTTLLAASEQIKQRNAALSTRTDEQAHALTEVVSAMEQLNSAAQQTSAQSQNARQLAADTRRVAQRGGENLQAAVQSMAQISQESQRISAILELIDGIAFQTNILSLNASVEAASAGEYGKGFAVVAAEVRTLATRSEQAAKDIRQLITTSSASTHSGAQQVQQAGVTMQEIITRIGQLTGLVDELSAMSEQQKSSIAQMQDSITSIDSSVQDNVAHVAETLHVAEVQQQQTDALQQAIAVFRLA
ncbi:methyl-accepting chemotaxis protein [Erwinia sp. V71]|uniref:methyl-accepting chemotaxis protein n=1 Tax=Erwinia sp. V71 TaxID=3369424 RepID=UPI003F5F611F